MSDAVVNHYVRLLLHGEMSLVDCMYLPERLSQRVYRQYRSVSFGEAADGRSYAITLTTYDGETADDIRARIDKLVASRLISSKYLEYAIEHDDSNVHAHVYLTTDKFVKARDVLRMNDNRRVDVKLLKGIDIVKWRKYICKDGTPIVLVDSAAGATT